MKILIKKEELIYDAVSNLTKQGKDIKELKVEEIARAANIAKGSIYEYFKSKDEIILKSINYFILKKIAEIIRIIDSQECFDTKIRSVLKTCSHAPSSDYAILKNINFKLDNHRVLSKEILTEFLNLADKIIDAGIKEGQINIGLGQDYQRYVLASAFCAHMTISSIKEDNKKFDYDLDTHINNTVMIIKKSLS